MAEKDTTTSIRGGERIFPGSKKSKNAWGNSALPNVRNARLSAIRNFGKVWEKRPQEEAAE